MICILDYGSGNVNSVFNMFKTLNDDVRISNEASVIEEASHIVLPGVGAFGAAMEKIKSRLPLEVLESQVKRRRKPFLGICVGLQVLADKGYEFGEHPGLGWIPGYVEKLKDPRLPHIGWNNLKIRRENPILAHFKDEQDFYFVHSYAFKPKDAAHSVATTFYGEEFSSLLNYGNIYGVQFHPEKSQRAGLQLIKNFLSLS